MNKAWYKSKTLWGFGAFFLLQFMQEAGFMDASVITELMKAAASIFGVYGARDAITQTKK